jgi:hypothetical protein
VRVMCLQLGGDVTNQFANRGKSSVTGLMIIVRYVTPLRTVERDG